MAKSSEPIVISGIGCRFPGGVVDPDSFWQLLLDKRDTVAEVPADRWNTKAFFDPDPNNMLRSHSKWASCMERIDQFDAPFFGLSDREVDYTDPQQRLLLEATWEAIEDGGYVLEALRSLSPGVFVGISTNDYAMLQTAPEVATPGSPFSATGTSTCIASNRISYSFDFTGPGLAVDTACSSSLVAFHLACQSLERGECRMAFVGGVNTIILPTTFIAFSNMSASAADGRCKAFDARADGFVRCEGVGVLALRRLEDALRDGDRIYAVVRGSGMNQDGRTQGLTFPNKTSQIAVVRDTCRRAGISPDTIRYVEAHGTGTPAGDQVEAHALGQSVGLGRLPGNECVVGSVKTNIGHPEAAAGVAGLIKCCLMLRHGLIPANLHFETPNPAIDFQKLKIRVPTETESLYGPGGRRTRPIVAINSFGFGGTNAFALLQAAPRARRAARVNAPDAECPTVAPEPSAGFLLPLSARSPEALAELAARFVRHLTQDNGEATLAALCKAAGTHRTHHPFRLAAAGLSREALITALSTFSEGGNASSVCSGHCREAPAAPVFVFSGQGPQWYAMGRALAHTQPVYRRTLEACHEILASWADWSLLDELMADEAHSRLHDTAIAQPAICALQLGLAALWQSWGIRPAAVVGHSVGEVAAAHVAGALSLEQALRVIFHRGRCMSEVPPGGRMLAAGISEADAVQRLAPHADGVSLAAINGPESVTFSGDPDALASLAEGLERDQRFNRFVPVEYAFHSSQMEPVRKSLLAALDGLEPSDAGTPIASTVTGTFVPGRTFDAAYWWRNVRQTVRFAPAMQTLTAADHRTFVELAAHPVLASSMRQCLQQHDEDEAATVLPSLNRKEDDRQTLLQSLGALYCKGHDVDWLGLCGPRDDGEAWTRLPRYAWQHKSYWREMEPWRRWRQDGLADPMLLWRRDCPRPTWDASIERHALPYINDHRVNGQLVFPATGYVALVLGVAQHILSGDAYQLENVEFKRPLVIQEDAEDPLLRIEFEPDSHRVDIFTRTSDKVDGWALNASCSLAKREGREASRCLDLDHLRSQCPHELTAETLYQFLRGIGLQYGPLFRGANRIFYRENEVVARIQLPARLVDELPNYPLHPVILDSCFQIAAAASPMGPDGGGRGGFMPVSIQRLRWFAPAPALLWVHALKRSGSAQHVELDFTLATEDGRVIAEVEQFRCEAVGVTSVHETGIQRLFHEFQWQRKPLAAPARHLKPCPALAFMPEPRAVLEAIGREDRQNRADAPSHPTTQTTVDRVAALMLYRSLTAGTPGLAAGASPTPAQATSADGAEGPNQPLVELCFRWLEQDGYLAPANGKSLDKRTVLKNIPNDPEIDALWRTALTENPSCLAELILMRTCAERVAATPRHPFCTLGPRTDAQESVLREQLAGSSAAARQGAAALATALRTVVDALPDGRMLNILEVYGGQGSLGRKLVAALPADRCRYCFTDPSAAMLDQAEPQLADHAFVQCRTFDPQTESQGEEAFEQPFDVVLAGDLSFATRDRTNRLRRMVDQLAPGGLLAFGVDAHPSRVASLVACLCEERQSAAELLEADRHAMGTPDWLEPLSRVATNAACLAPGGDADNADGRTIFVAQAKPEADALRTETEPRTNATDERPTPKGGWILLGNRRGPAQRLAELLRRSGRSTEILCIHADDRAPNTGATNVDVRDAEAVADAVRRAASAHKTPCRGIVYLCQHETDKAEPASIAALSGARSAGFPGVLHLVQALLAGAAGEKMPGLTLVTQAAQPVGLQGGALDVSQAPVLGLGRVIASEAPSLQCRRIDLPGLVTDTDLLALADELTEADDGEDELALRGEARYAQRLVRAQLEDRARREDASDAYRLEIGEPGLLAGLVFRPRTRRAPGPDEIEIAVGAAGLNFRDIMKTLGMYPREAEDVNLLGDEVAGRIVRIGDRVTHFKPGDRVVAFASGCLASHVVTHAAFALPLPPEMGLAEGATLLVNYVTAAYALHHLAHITRGERVLIHAGAGGVGMAAVRLALAAGAEVFATAGNPIKRGFLRALGVHHVMDSRSLAFADEIRAATRGEGIDVVLNSLAGQAIPRSLELLRFGGRFVEIGKRDIYGGSQLDLAPFRRGLSFFAVDLQQVIRPDRIGDVLVELRKLVADGVVQPLPYRAFPMHAAHDAFQHMAQAKHIGKIVLTTGGTSPRLEAAIRLDPLTLRDDATYLITGGLRGVGLSIAEWFAQRGARHLILTSRSGITTPEAKDVLTRLEQMGVQLMAQASDVADPAALASLLQRAQATMPPLRGVVHGAMVLRDKTLAQQDLTAFEEVMAPKAYGAWNLHLQTRECPLDFFVLMSSISAVTGSPGQASYAAANAFEDALAHDRRRQGLPALSVNWDMILEVGVAARSQAIGDHLKQAGLLGLSPEQVHQALGRLLVNHATQMCVTNVDWNKLLGRSGLVSKTPRFVALRGTDEEAPSDMDASRLHVELARAAPEERQALLETFLQSQVAKVLRVPTQKVDIHTRLDQLGIDSLMGVELAVRIESQLGIPVASHQLATTPTVGGLAEALVGRMMVETGEEGEAPARNEPTANESDNDGHLADSLSVSTAPVDPTRAESPGTVLLTGATGFLGAYLVAELLDQTSADVHCLVRASDVQSGMSRVLGNLDAYGLAADPSKRARLRIWPGDVSQPGLGLRPDQLTELAESMDAIYHSAADVSHVRSYAELRPTNVLGTLEVLKVAAAGRPTPLHFVSSIAALGGGPVDSDVKHMETDESSLAYQANGYGKTKCVAESLVRALRERGLPVTCHRPGLLAGDARTGVSIPDDLIWRLVKTSIQSGLAPESSADMCLTPVDYVARAIVWLSLHKTNWGQTFHLLSRERVSLADLLTSAEQLGYPFRRVPLEEWVHTVAGQALKEAGHPMRPLIQAYGEDVALTTIGHRIAFSTEATQKALDPSDISCPPTDAAYLQNCLRYFVHTGYLPEPGKSSSHGQRT